jgi:hypothetical protein
VNGSGGDIDLAEMSFAPFDAVVLGDLTPSEHGDRLRGCVVRRLALQRSVFGYLSVGPGQGQPNWSDVDLGSRIEAWTVLGATGVLLDCAGQDFGVSGRRLRRAVKTVHRVGLSVLVNAWNPGDLLDGDVPLGPGDGYLAENDVLRHGGFRPPAEYAPKLSLARRCRDRFGVTVWCAATLAPGAVGYDDALVEQVIGAWEGVGAGSPDVLVVADPLYGARTNEVLLPGGVPAQLATVP